MEGFEFHKASDLKIIFKDCEEYNINNRAVINNKKEFNIITIHQEIDEFKITEDEFLLVEIATNLNISEDVIGIIAGLAASEVEGIAGMQLGFVDGINQMFGNNKKYSKGVKIELEGRNFEFE